MDPVFSRREALGGLAAFGAAFAFGAREASAQPPRRPRRGPAPGRRPADSRFAGLAQRHGFEAEGPGLAVLVVRPPRAGAMFFYGLADMDSESPIGPRTIFELASVSKTITSTATLMLMERKKLSLEDDVRNLIPELPTYDAQRPVRIEDLLRHTSGLPDYMGFGDVPVKNGDFAVNDDYIPEFAKRKETAPLVFPTGSKYEYNNTNYMLLATIVARASGKSYGAFLRDEVFGPAGMDDTFVYDAPASVPEGASAAASVGYTREGEAWQPGWSLPPGRKEWLLTVGDGGVWSNLHDMKAWDAALHAGKFVSRDTAKLALSRTTTSDGQAHGYGLGWTVYPGEGDRLNGYGHNGIWGGFVHTYYHEPDPNLTTVVLSNRGDFDVDKFWDELRAMINDRQLAS